VLGAVAAAIWIESVIDPKARGPVLFREHRVAEGRIIELLKFRTLDADALASLGDGPTHIGVLEREGRLTRTGRVVKQWYLDELPQLINIARGDIGLVGTRPYPVELYEQELAAGVTRKRDMPSGLVGPVQSRKGQPMDGVALDAEYWDQCQRLPAWRLALVDARIVLRSARVLLEHRGL
jgi:lipopolysaccharide/colanic/teichoic acid biosynthesis glycosyltransferase